MDNQHKIWIGQAMMDDWGIHYPHKFQIHAIHHIASHHDQIVYIIAKTGSGKSEIPLPIGSLPTGVTLSMVPLVGLGSDQVINSRHSKNLIEAYHLDKNPGCDGYALRSWLLSLHPHEAECVSIFFYVLPQSLKEGSFWYKCLFELASKNLIQLICIDKAHSVAQNGRNFRPKFCSAVKMLRSI
jgi:superfamily II DNA helicase RecQ